MLRDVESSHTESVRYARVAAVVGYEKYDRKMDYIITTTLTGRWINNQSQVDKWMVKSLVLGQSFFHFSQVERYMVKY